MTDYDAIVCGGGTAGPVVASRLVEAGRSVLLIEAGPDYGAFAEGRWPADMLDARTIPVSHDWGYTSGDELPARSLAYERARVIGGCSAHNGCTVSWGHRDDYDGWAARGLEGWSADDLFPLFDETSTRMRVRRFANDEVAPFHRGFVEAGVAMGLAEADDLDTLDGGMGVCVEPSNSPDGVRWNAAFAYLDPVRDRAHLTVRGDTTVDRVIVEGGRAVGVRAIGPLGEVEIHAGLVVVCAGVYGSPAILMRSGIGPADELRALDIDAIVDLPVGRNLHDHPSFELTFAPSEELARRTAEFEAAGHVVPDEQGFAKGESGRAQAAGEPFDLHVFPEISMDGHLGVFVAMLTPRARGALTLRDADPASAPRLDHAFLSDPDHHDLEALVDGVELARAFAATEPFASLLDRELEPGPDAPARHDLRDAVRAGVIHYWHPVGTCAMGSVTDADGHVQGVDGLVVADASVMPVTPRATTNIPTVVVAERIARALTYPG
ncbi:MAG: GMC family oxidoreductase N-terminal domain-containing protein [Thermoleophilia bacterium]|nr:GMC family oxidoreductase N-terminal domain-containing protein [Thermoleophilia bacterium]MDH5224667.1 GMC family oxidoreductase N-terminal domain-containing protein [Actinomycetota bacterium]MDH5312860.1 GMC family oxidoreductase N-terminal domain-containing protein [Actinomycetota bacterium]